VPPPSCKKGDRKVAPTYSWEMITPRLTVEKLEKLEGIIHQKSISMGITSKITKEVLMEYIVTPSTDIDLINSYINTLKNSVSPMKRELVGFEAV
jgi:hypothetical protein